MSLLEDTTAGGGIELMLEFGFHILLLVGAFGRLICDL